MADVGIVAFRSAANGAPDNLHRAGMLFCAERKFSGLLFGPIVLLALFAPPCLGGHGLCWVVNRAPACDVHHYAALLCCVVVAAISMSRSGQSIIPLSARAEWKSRWRLNMSYVIDVAKHNELEASFDPVANRPKPRMKAHRPKLIVRAVEFANEHRLLPQAWLHGLLYTYGTTLIRSSFLMGKYSLTRWWYFSQ